MEKAKAILDQTGIPFDVATMYAEIAWADDEIGDRARYCDLTLVGDGLMADPELRSRTLDGALFRSACPILIVPRGKTATLTPKKVVLAWDSGFEAARARGKGHSGRRRSRAGHDGRSARQLRSQWRRTRRRHRGIPCSPWRLGRRRAVPSEGRSIDEGLNRYARDASAELMVMGAYCHSRMRERVFGRLTRPMLETASVPVLMVH